MADKTTTKSPATNVGIIQPGMVAATGTVGDAGVGVFDTPTAPPLPPPLTGTAGNGLMAFAETVCGRSIFCSETG
jgi:hypothetical protein